MKANTPPSPPNPVPLADSARKVTDEHLTEYAKAVNPQQREKEAPLLAVASARETAAVTLLAADRVAIELTSLTRAIDRSSAATDASTRQLTTWTRVMAWATIALAVFAIAQVVVAVVALFRAP